MKQIWMRIFRCVLAAALCGFFLFCLSRFTQPLSSEVYDFSIDVEDGTEWDGDAKGWDFYCEDTAGGRTELTLDSTGSCLLPAQGITFAYSRTLTEPLRIPQLSIRLSICNIAVLLDGSVLYNDCPDIDPTLPGAQLSSVDWDRFETVSIPLPEDYVGKTLTILQSTPSYGETSGTAKGYLCGVTLANDKASDSSLISAGYTLSIQTVLLFLAGAVTLCSGLFRPDVKDFSYAVLSLTAFFQMIHLLASSGFWKYYVAAIPFDPAYLANDLSFLTLLTFLTLRLSRHSRLFWGVCAGELAVLILKYLSQTGSLAFSSFLIFTLPAVYGICALAGLFAAGIGEYRRKNLFFRNFLPSVAGIALLWLMFLLAGLPLGFSWAEGTALKIQLMWRQDIFLYLLTRLHLLSLIASVISACICFLQSLVRRHTQAQYLKDRSEMALASYRQLLQSDRQVMMLHHDMRHHLATLSEMDNLDEIRAYLSQLTSQEQHTQVFLRSGNEFLDTILNGKLTRLDRHQITLEIVRCNAPKKLKLTDVELCSIVMNVIENAIEGACRSGAEKPFIRLDMHTKDDVFVCVVENSAKLHKEPARPSDSVDPLPVHGWGLHIIRQIMDTHGYAMDAKQTGDIYKVVLTIPSDMPS